MKKIGVFFYYVGMPNLLQETAKGSNDVFYKVIDAV